MKPLHPGADDPVGRRVQDCVNRRSRAARGIDASAGDEEGLHARAEAFEMFDRGALGAIGVVCGQRFEDLGVLVDHRLVCCDPRSCIRRHDHPRLHTAKILDEQAIAAGVSDELKPLPADRSFSLGSM